MAEGMELQPTLKRTLSVWWLLAWRGTLVGALMGGALGFVIGLWNGATSTLVQALFVKQLVANNPWMVARFEHAPRGFDMQFFVFMLVPFIGVTGGALTALVAMLMRRALSAARERGRRGETSP